MLKTGLNMHVNFVKTCEERNCVLCKFFDYSGGFGSSLPGSYEPPCIRCTKHDFEFVPWVDKSEDPHLTLCEDFEGRKDGCQR